MSKKNQVKSKPKAEVKAEVKAGPQPTKDAMYERNPKLPDPQSILKKYDELINDLARMESKQRLANKPFRVYFIHRQRMEVMKQNFIKSMR